MALDEDAGLTNLDGWGCKRLFSHILRRWLAGASAPRDSCREYQINTIVIISSLFILVLELLIVIFSQAFWDIFCKTQEN